MTNLFCHSLQGGLMSDKKTIHKNSLSNLVSAWDSKSLAEFEQPKLARVEQTIEDVGANELSDEELDAKLRRLLDENPKNQ